MKGLHRGCIETYRDKSGRWRYRVIAKNYQITETAGQSYSRRQSARRAALRFHPSHLIYAV